MRSWSEGRELACFWCMSASLRRIDSLFGLSEWSRGRDGCASWHRFRSREARTMRERDTHRAVFRFDSCSLSLIGRVCGVLLIGSHESTRCLGIRCCLVVGMGARHGIASATVERERCVSETRIVVVSVAVVVGRPCTGVFVVYYSFLRRFESLFGYPVLSRGRDGCMSRHRSRNRRARAMRERVDASWWSRLRSWSEGPERVCLCCIIVCLRRIDSLLGHLVWSRGRDGCRSRHRSRNRRARTMRERVDVVPQSGARASGAVAPSNTNGTCTYELSFATVIGFNIFAFQDVNHVHGLVQ